MSLNVSALAKDMVAAFTGVLKDKAPDIKSYAESEAKKLAHTLVMIEKLVIVGKIDEEEAKLHLEIQKNAARTVFLTIEGLGVLAVEQAINAALDVVKGAVNKALGFALL
ncbi:MAG: hypothetical protein ACREUJ_03225 [Burkholderiales bacterium]